MASNTLRTRIVLRNDSTANWKANENTVLLPGEIGVELFDDGKVKIKIGNKNQAAWKDLPYYAGDEAHVFKATPVEKETDLEAINKAVGQTELSKSDIAIVSRTIHGDKAQLTAYAYTGTEWAAMDGNYNAENVFFANDLVTTAAVGNISLINGQATIPAAGKNLLEVFNSIFVKAKDPEVTDPVASVTLNKTGSFEVGTTITPTFTASLTAGEYSFGPDTGVAATGYTVTDTAGHTASTATGSFDAFTVEEDTNYKVSATITHNEGANPKDNTGVEKENLKIAAGSKTASSGTVKGYRAWFQGYKTAETALDPSALSSEQVRALGTKRNGSFTSTMETTGMQQMFFAAPKGKVTSLKVANAVNGAPQTVTKGSASVEGVDGYVAADYDVFYVANAVAESGASKYTITVS